MSALRYYNVGTFASVSDVYCEAGTIRLSDGLLLSDVNEESCLSKCLHVT